MPQSSSRVLEACALYLIVLGTAWAFWPGVTGPFLFDDFPNLQTLKFDGGVHDFASAVRFVFGGGSGPGGRPLSLVTFLLNDDGWPSDPRGFKITNIWIHALNGVLVFCLLTKLRDIMAQQGTKAAWLPLAGTAIWLLHPVQAAAIFLVIQRMTLLFSMFALLALLLWLKGRALLFAGRPRLGYLAMSSSVVVLTPLAVLCKETAVTIPLSIWALEWTLAPLPRTGWARAWKGAFFALPTALCIGYFAAHWGGLTAGFNIRNFGPWQRVATEMVILPDYLFRILVPRLTVSIYNDDFVPVTWRGLTLRDGLSIGLMLLLVPLAILLRRRRPVYAFAIAFFLAGHWLESGPLSLELYFLHRNYLPMLGPICALAVFPAELEGGMRWIGIVLVCGFMLLCAGVTRVSAFDWGDQGRLATDWANEHPRSTRAQMYAAQYWASKHDTAKVLEYVDRATQLDPDALSSRAAQYLFNCVAGHERRALWESMTSRLRQARYETSLANSFGTLHDAIKDKTCTQISDTEIIEAIEEVIDHNPAYSAPHAQGVMALELSSIFRDEGDYAHAVGALEYVNRMEPSDANLALQVTMLLDAGQLSTALDKLEQEKLTADDPAPVRAIIGQRDRLKRINAEQAAIRRTLERREQLQRERAAARTH